MDRLTEACWVFGRFMAENQETSPANIFVKYSDLLRSKPTTEPSSSTAPVEVCLYGCHQHPRNVCLWIELGHAYYDRGDESAAERAWSHASQLDPANPDIWAHLSLLYLKQNKLEIASHVGATYSTELLPVDVRLRYWTLPSRTGSKIGVLSMRSWTNGPRRVLQKKRENWQNSLRRLAVPTIYLSVYPVHQRT